MAGGATSEAASEHCARIVWEGTKADLRAHRIEVSGRVLEGSAMPEVGGDPERADPEELFTASLSACHMLWFLARARGRRLRVRAYADDAVGTLSGDRITRVLLRPQVEFEDDPGSAAVAELHEEAHERCFLARSVNFPVEVEA